MKVEAEERIQLRSRKEREEREQGDPDGVELHDIEDN